MAKVLTQELVNEIVCEAKCCLADKFSAYLSARENGNIQLSNDLLKEAQRAEAVLEALRTVDLNAQEVECLTEDEVYSLISRVKELCGCGKGNGDTGVIEMLTTFEKTGWKANGTEEILCAANCCMADFFGEYLCAISNGDIKEANKKLSYARQVQGLIFIIDGYVNNPEAENCLSEEEVEKVLSMLSEYCGCLDLELKPAQPFVFFVLGSNSTTALVDQEGSFIGISL